jgi:murein L,D-transpeptidase YcbB/YkuD
LRLAAICALIFGIAFVSQPDSEFTAQQMLRGLAGSGRLAELRWPDFSHAKGWVESFYGPAAYEPAWSRAGAPTAQAKALIEILRHADAKGLEPEDYDASRWAGRLARLQPAAKPSAHDLALFDLALTVSGLRFISDLRVGRVNPSVFCFGLDTAQKQCDLAGTLRRLAASDDVLLVVAGLEPPFPGYRRLEQALATYTKLSREDDQELLPPLPKKAVDPGSVYAGVPRLDRLLRRLGDLPAAAELPSGSMIYQAPLVEALKHFQARHGLEPDGRIGKATLAQLNTPLSYRVRQIQLTLERWRWAPLSFPRPPIVVNIPEFRLRALDDRYEPELEMKVVVGGAYRHQTPVFTNDMTHVIFRPYWNVPLSIQRAELVPKIANDPFYLAENDYEIVSARGVLADAPIGGDVLNELRSGKLAIRQRPGKKNALGFVKFMFPNEYNVYLHGTPAQALFSKSRRDFSHGCIRVEKPEELAAWVLGGLPEWTPERIREAESGTRTLQVNLTRPIPVLIVYGTAVARENGEVFFFDDIYGHDASLNEVLSHGYPYSGWQRPVNACPRPEQFGELTSGGYGPDRRERNRTWHSSPRRLDAMPEPRHEERRSLCRAGGYRWPRPAYAGYFWRRRWYGVGGTRCSRACGTRRSRRFRPVAGQRKPPGRPADPAGGGHNDARRRYASRVENGRRAPGHQAGSPPLGDRRRPGAHRYGYGKGAGALPAELVAWKTQ